MDKFLLVNSPLLAGFAIAVLVLAFLRMEAVRLTLRDAWAGVKRVAQRLGDEIRSDLLLAGQIGGYVHDTAMSVTIPSSIMGRTLSTWTTTVNPNAANDYMQRRTAADAAPIVVIPIPLPQNAVALKGSYLKSVNVEWECTVAAMDAVTAAIYKSTRAVNGSARAAATSIAFSYDGNHDSAAKRLTLAKHQMTLTLTTPFWMDDDDEVIVEMTYDAAATSVLDIYNARANFTLRL